ncbi:MAG TPA: histidine kinase [Desulfobacteraceae bacterium]|nr:histidine kinase [Desulfobacteraceae bacterium]
MKEDNIKKNTGSMPKNPREKTSQKNTFSNNSALTACQRLSNERYQAFVDNIEEGVYEVDIHGNFLYFNDSLCKVLGYPREEIQFKNFDKFMDEDNAKKAFAYFNKCYQTGNAVSDLIWKTKDKGGNPRIIEFSANLVRNKEGEKIGFRGIARDIRNKYEAQETLRKSERRYRTLLDFVPYPIVVFTVDGRVSYLNSAFTEIFGWTLDQLEGKTIPYVPPGLYQETDENIKRLFEEKVILRHKTQRLTKDGRILDVVFRAAVFSETEDEPSGEIVLLRDITQEKRIAKNNEAMLRISMALPEYPDLAELLDFISNEVKSLLGTEGALILLLDEEKSEFYFLGAAYDDTATQKRVKEARFPINKVVAGKIIKSGEPIIIPDTSKDPDFYPERDEKLGYHTKSLLEVPIRSSDRIIGVLGAVNKKEGHFDQTDVELLSMIAGTVALSIENARFSKEVTEAYKEVTSLNRAKDRVINHLSHELKTPLSVLGASIKILTKRLSSLPRETWYPTINRAKRNLERILEMQYQVEDIMRDKHYDTHYVISQLLDECSDELLSLVAEEVGEGSIVENIERRIDELFGPKESPAEDIFLDQFIAKALEEIRPLFSHRKVDLITGFEPGIAIRMPVDPLKKIVIGLIKNAIENTPDEGKIEVSLARRSIGAELVVRDYGVGITAENQRRIFEGFFVTQKTMDYSSKRPFDFNAGGKGADLLRMKIFSERYNFNIDMISSRCKYIPLDKDICPGKISECAFCKKKEDCYQSGGTTFTVFFPSAFEEGSLQKDNY